MSSLNLQIIETQPGCFLLSVSLAFPILSNTALERTEILDFHLQDSPALLSAASETDPFSCSFDVQLTQEKIALCNV